MTVSDKEKFVIAGLGELIWDLLPTGKRLGGAPSNFAQISALLGDSGVIASRVGNDQNGAEALAALSGNGISIEYIQLDSEHPTGTVGVTIGEHGEPKFLVNQNSAWDYLEFPTSWKTLATRVDAVCFGTLGQRHPKARHTIKQFLKATRPDCLRIFDVNLRHSFFTRALLEDSLNHASIVKLNHEEIVQVGALLDCLKTSERSIGTLLIDKFTIELVAITHGPVGCSLISGTEVIEHHGFESKVVDTIGAGDAFTAMLAHLYLRNISLKEIAEKANRMGAWMTMQCGATPVISREELPIELKKLQAKTRN